MEILIDFYWLSQFFIIVLTDSLQRSLLLNCYFNSPIMLLGCLFIGCSLKAFFLIRSIGFVVNGSFWLILKNLSLRYVFANKILAFPIDVFILFLKNLSRAQIFKLGFKLMLARSQSDLVLGPHNRVLKLLVLLAVVT